MADVAEDLPIDPDLFRQVLEQLDLKFIALDRVEAACDRAALDPSSTKIGITIFFEDVHGEGIYIIKVRYILSGIKDEAEVLKIEAIFAVTFGTGLKVPSAFLEPFASTSLTHITMPYLRELIASLTGRMAIPMLTIPLRVLSVEEPDGGEKAGSTSTTA